MPSPKAIGLAEQEGLNLDFAVQMPDGSQLSSDQFYSRLEEENLTDEEFLNQYNAVIRFYTFVRACEKGEGELPDQVVIQAEMRDRLQERLRGGQNVFSNSEESE